VEHRARGKIHHLVLFASKSFISAQLFFSGFNSFSTILSGVILFFYILLFMIVPLACIVEPEHKSVNDNEAKKSYKVMIFSEKTEILDKFSDGMIAATVCLTFC
jgi:uncharacterized membrane protein